MEGACGDEEHMVRADRAILRGHRRALDDGEEIPLHTFPGDVGALSALPAGDLVHLVQEDDPGGLGPLDGLSGNLLLIHQPGRLVLSQDLSGLGDRKAASLGPVAEQAGEKVFEVDVHLLGALVAQNLEAGHRSLGNVHLHRPSLELPGSELGPELLPGLAEGGVAGWIGRGLP